MKHRDRALFGVAMACLFVSGVAGLIYEVVWARYLALFLGHTSYAVVAVLVAFMGGMAIGNLVFGRLADRVERPLIGYAWLEIGIGVYALLFPFYQGLVHEAYVGVARAWQPGTAILFGLKFAFSLSTILLPAMLMGGTLPLLTKLLTRSVGEVRGNVAALYFINSAGAVVGAWLAGFVLIEAVGLEATVLAGATLNLAAGLGAYLIAQSAVGLAGRAPIPVAGDEARPAEVFSPSDLRLVIWGIGLSGFVAMLYQVTWTRLLALALGSSTHAFALMLITFIAGLTIGSALIYRWRSLRDTMSAFGWAELALAGSVAGSMWFYDALPYGFVRLAGMLVRRVDVYPVYSVLQGAICFAVMLVPTICLGMTLPLASRVATADSGRTGSSVGRVFAVNTLGTVLGAVVSGLWMLPTLGLARTFAAGVVVNAGIGLAVLGRRRRVVVGPIGLLVGAGAGVLVVGLAGAILDARWSGTLTMGLWRIPEAPATWKPPK